MTAEDRLRSRLRSEAASMPVGSSSLSSVQARAARLQRRRNAVRSGAGACALVAVALVGVVSLRNGGIDEYATTVAESDDAAEAVEAAAMPATTVGVAASADDDMAAEVEFAAGAATSEEESQRDAMGLTEGAQASAEEFLDSDVPEEEMADESENWETTSPARSDPEAPVFATTVSIVQPPPAVEGAGMRYSFSGQHAVARAADNWYAYDGTDWQSVGLPDDLEVVAVDLSGPGRIAVFGVVRPLQCDRAQVVAVRTDARWSYVRVDDGTPPLVAWELLDARIRVTDAGVELERVERLWLDDRCAGPTDDEELDEAAAKLVADLELLGEIWRDSWLHALLDGGFAERWPSVARSDAVAAAASGADLGWAAMLPPRYTTPAVKLNPSRSTDDVTATVALHETTIMEVATTVHVSGGMAMLQRGEQTWEVCPIPDDELHQVHGQIGQAGEHLAVVVGKPDETLFIVERTE